MGVEVLCLLPVRNGALYLPDHLAAAGELCDGIVALDDGSTDQTHEILAGDPLVRVLLTNPRRHSYSGWDDRANRARLLDAAGNLDPAWIIFLDADERMDVEDARALRSFLRTDALPGCAYGFQHYRMWGPDRYDPSFRIIYRLFAYESGQTLPAQRLHFNPIPTTIPSSRWITTTIRVRHFGAHDERSRQERLAKYREADPSLDFPDDHSGLNERPPGELPVWPQRPPGLPVILAAGDPRLSANTGPAPDASARRSPQRPKLVCLLPARNCQDDLPGYLASVARFADAVVALDDGSTDQTRQILAEDPLVKVLVTNPRREGYAGWDDGANRNRLLEAAAELDPEWVLELDADERIPADDAAALRRFVQDDAVPGFAYGFRVYRMIGDEQHYDRAGLWVYRLFAYEPGQRVPDVLQHFVPVPTSIPRSNWLRTTVRIQHLSSLTEERRRARYAKYVEADPERAYQPDYKHLLDEPGRVRAWKPRPSALPVLVDPLGKQRVNEFVLEDLDLDAPLLSAVVIARNDEERIERVLGSVVSQRCPFPFEVIAVVSGTDRTAEIVRDRFPEVTLIELEGAALPGRARNAGVEVARGDYVSFPGSHVELPPGSLAARLAAHERGYPMVTGETHNGTRTRSGWASYFLDHAVNLPGQPAGELVGPPAHCSYARDLLIEVGGFPTDMRAGEDTTVNLELARRGYVAYRSSDVKLVHHTRCSNPLRLIRHHFSRGRAYGKILLEGRVFRGAGARRKLTRHVIVYVRQRIKATTRNVRTADPEMWKTYRRVFPLVVTAVVAAWLGLLSKLLSTPLTGRDRKARGSSAPAPQGSMRGTARAGGSA